MTVLNESIIYTVNLYDIRKMLKLVREEYKISHNNYYMLHKFILENFLIDIPVGQLSYADESDDRDEVIDRCLMNKIHGDGNGSEWEDLHLGIGA